MLLSKAHYLLWVVKERKNTRTDQLEKLTDKRTDTDTILLQNNIFTD